MFLYRYIQTYIPTTFGDTGKFVMYVIRQHYNMEIYIFIYIFPSFGISACHLLLTNYVNDDNEGMFAENEGPIYFIHNSNSTSPHNKPVIR
jgi:hypothetical protein